MKRVILFMMGLVLLLAACSAQAPTTATGSPVIPPALPTATPQLTGTPLPGETASPIATNSLISTLPPQSIKFAVIGDYGMDNSAEADVSALIHGWHPDIILTTGDNNYPSGEENTIDANIGKYFQDYIHPYTGKYGPGADLNRFFPTLGNHDWLTTGAQPYLDYFTLPGNDRYYDFVWGPVHFFALDSDEHEPDGVNSASVQAEWLKQALAGSTSPWNIVYMHYPPYSSGTHGSITWMRWPFAAWGTDAVLAGHDHLYERLLVDGIPYYIEGAGGGGLYNFVVPLLESQSQYNDDYGAMLVTANAISMHFEFYNRLGVLVDNNTLLKP